MAVRRFSLIIPAAGSGTRMGRNHNKLLIQLAGRPVLWHTLKAFEDCPGLAEIILAVRPVDLPELDAFLAPGAFAVPIRTVFGGDTRQASVYNGLRAVAEASEAVWVHDGARPFVRPEVLARLATAQEQHASRVVAVPVKDTVKRTDADGVVLETPDRNGLWLVQTPQAFARKDLLAANEKALAAGFEGTDDASLMEWAGYTVIVVPGDYFNIKITTPEDLVLAEAILDHFKRS